MFVRGISPSAHDRFVKLPARQLEVKPTAPVEAAPLPPSLPEGGPQSESALIQSLQQRIAELEARLDNREPNRLFIRNVIKAVCDYYEISRDEILSRRRSQYIVRPRQIAIYLARTLTRASLPEIGTKLGGLDHTTCLHAVRKVEELMASDPQIFETVEFLKKKLYVDMAVA